MIIIVLQKTTTMKKYDIIVIGMGPAGMAVSAMGASMGLDVLAVEKHKVGGECLNVGCIPSKALLKAAEANNTAHNLRKYGIESDIVAKHNDPMKSLGKEMPLSSIQKPLPLMEKNTLERKFLLAQEQNHLSLLFQD